LKALKTLFFYEKTSETRTENFDRPLFRFDLKRQGRRHWAG